MPWFSGLCLNEELAGLYEMEAFRKGQGSGTPSTSSKELTLDGLGPITIFVRANNSGESRLMREPPMTQGFPSYKQAARDENGLEINHELKALH